MNRRIRPSSAATPEVNIFPVAWASFSDQTQYSPTALYFATTRRRRDASPFHWRVGRDHTRRRSRSPRTCLMCGPTPVRHARVQRVRSPRCTGSKPVQQGLRTCCLRARVVN